MILSKVPVHERTDPGMGDIASAKSIKPILLINLITLFTQITY